MPVNKLREYGRKAARRAAVLRALILGKKHSPCGGCFFICFGVEQTDHGFHKKIIDKHKLILDKR